jgi:hypothetical protein
MRYKVEEGQILPLLVLGQTKGVLLTSSKERA